MKRIALYTTLVILAGAAWSADFGASGFAVGGERAEDGTTYTVLKDQSGREVLFRAVVEPTAQRLGALRSLVADLPSWKGLDLGLITAVNEAERLQVVAVPRKLMYGGADLAPNLPGGLAFYYATSVEYDFRVVSGLYVVRIRGVLTGSAEVLDSIAGAVKDPVNFLATRDPQYSVRKITETQIKLEEYALVHKDIYARAEELSGRADAAEGRVDALEVRANESELRADRIEGALGERSAALEGRVGKEESRSAALEGRATALEGRSTALEGRATVVEGRATAVEGRAATLEGRATGVEKRAGALEGRADAVESRASALETRAGDLEGRATGLEGRAAELEGRSTALESRAGELEGRTDALEGRASELEGRASALEDRVTALEAALLGLSDRTDARFAEAERIAAEKETAAAARDKELEAARAAEAARVDEYLMMSMNRGLFSAPKRIDPPSLARLLEMKAKDPALDRKAAEAALKAEKLPITAKEINIVFIVKFRDFPAK